MSVSHVHPSQGAFPTGGGGGFGSMPHSDNGHHVGAGHNVPPSDICAGCKRGGLNLLVCDDCVTGDVSGRPNTKQRFCSECMIGKKVRVFWPLDEQWYVGVVQRYDHSTGEHLLQYPDGDTEWVKIGENNTNSSAMGNPAGQPAAQSQGPGPGPGPAGSEMGMREEAAESPHMARQGHSYMDPQDAEAGARSSPDERQPMGGHGHGHAYGSPEQSGHAQDPNGWAGRGNKGSPGSSTPSGSNPQAKGANSAGGQPYGGLGPYPHPHHIPPGYGPPPHAMGHYGAQHYPHHGAHPGHGHGYPAPHYYPHPHHIPPHGAHPGAGGGAGKRGLNPMSPESGKGAAAGGGPKRKSGPKTWTKEEDNILLSMVRSMRMPMKWSIVAHSMPDRTGKQCRERYVNHLNPRLKSTEWSPSEDATIFHLYNTSGSQWAKMSKMIPGRTDNGIKNRFHNLRRQLEREDDHRLRLSKPEDFPDEIRLDRVRPFPQKLRGKSDDLWDMRRGIGVIAAQSVLGGGIARNAGRFGPFRPADPNGEQCARCGLYAPSAHCGTELCTKTRWCLSCTRVPPHVSGNLLRECLNLRRCQEADKAKVIQAWGSLRIHDEEEKMDQTDDQDHDGEDNDPDK